jgi:isopenicillin N synthase-like dioxygenase
MLTYRFAVAGDALIPQTRHGRLGTAFSTTPSRRSSLTWVPSVNLGPVGETIAGAWRPEERAASQSDRACMSPVTTDRLPILDFRRFDLPAERATFLDELREVSHDIGFFYLTGHGIAAASDEILALARRFFALDEAEKLAVQMVHSPQFRGYNRAGAERTRGRADWREQFDIGAERPTLAAGPAWARLQGPNQWPAALPELRPALLRWQAAATAVLRRLLGAFALALDQDEATFEPLLGDAPNQHVKLIRYPGQDRGGDGQGVGPHKDSSLLTLLLQDDRNGLQVETETGWIDAVPLAGSFVVNIGEQLELAANGYLRATMHRAVNPPPGTDRISAALFLGARLDTVIPVLDLPPDLAALAPGPAEDPLNPLYHETGRNYLKGRLRSHPDVARRHHADLL